MVDNEAPQCKNYFSYNTIFLLNILNRVVDNILHEKYFHDKLIAR